MNYYDVIGNRKITSDFGEKRAYYAPGKFHQGYDIAYSNNEPLLSAIDGIVANIGYDANGYGNYIDIANGNVKTRYAHANNFNVKKGDQIKAGQKIGLAGSTGHSTGPHLHMEFYNNGILTNPKELSKIMATQNTTPQNQIAQAYAQQNAAKILEMNPEIKQAAIDNLLSQLQPIQKPQIATIQDIFDAKKGDKLNVFGDWLNSAEAQRNIGNLFMPTRMDTRTGEFYNAGEEMAKRTQADFDKANKEYQDNLNAQNKLAGDLYGLGVDIDKSNIQNQYNYDKLNADNNYRAQTLNYEKDKLNWEKDENNPKNKPTPPSFSNITTVRKEFNSIPAIKNYAEIKRQRNNVVAVRKQFEGKGRTKYNANDQTLITTFNKILDPTSVVRESEFARTAAGQALFDQIKGAYDKMSKGGAGLSAQERENVFNAIEAMYRAQEEEAARYANDYRTLAEKYGIDSSDIIGTQFNKPSNDGNNTKSSNDPLGIR